MGCVQNIYEVYDKDTEELVFEGTNAEVAKKFFVRIPTVYMAWKRGGCFLEKYKVKRVPTNLSAKERFRAATFTEFSIGNLTIYYRSFEKRTTVRFRVQERTYQVYDYKEDYCKRIDPELNKLIQYQLKELKWI